MHPWVKLIASSQGITDQMSSSGSEQSSIISEVPNERNIYTKARNSAEPQSKLELDFSTYYIDSDLMRILGESARNDY